MAARTQPGPVTPVRGDQARPALESMLAARSVALVGASPRAGSFGARMLEEVTRSPSRPRVHLVNPRYAQIGEHQCHPSLADLPEPVDLVLLGVRDDALEGQLSLAAQRGDRAAVIFGNAHEDPAGAGLARGPEFPPEPGLAPGPGLRERLVTIARGAGMELCGAGCMGFINVSRGLRAIGYTEASPLAAGPVALVTHSGSVFSALLRTRRGLRFSLAVSSGQELVTAAPAYLEYALDLPETRVLALVLEAMRDPGRLRRVLVSAADRDIPVVLLTVGGSASGRRMVAAHSGALAAADGGWEALSRAYGVHRVGDLAELADTLELFAIARRPRRGPVPGAPGIATVHDSGLERAHTADLAEELGVPFAPISPATTARLTELLDPGLLPTNPLDVWGNGAETRELFAASLTALADDPRVAVVALAVDLVEELDGDRSYPLALLDAARRTDKPLAVLTSLPSAIDLSLAEELRQEGIPVLEGTRSGLLALRHLLRRAQLAGKTGGTAAPVTNPERQRRARQLLASGQASGGPLLGMLAEYGIAAAAAEPARDVGQALAAAESIGYPVVLKTDEPAIAHKSDVGGVLLGIRDPAELAAGYADLAARLGSRVLVCQTVATGPELALGITRDPGLGPLIVVGAGGVLVELLADRRVALPPVDEELATELLDGLRVRKLLAGVRGMPPAALGSIITAITGLSELACELGDELEALDVNPVICGPGGAVAVDALAIPRHPAGSYHRPDTVVGHEPRR
jgi:acyl-CoA synthetase (NDP forming)